MADLKRLAAEAALREMAEKGWFSICVIDKIRESAGLGRGAGDAYRTLSLLHCIHYDKMDPRIVAALPDLIADALQYPGLNFTLTKSADSEQRAIATAEPPEKKRGVLSWLR